jgi:hypothetical protein
MAWRKFTHFLDYYELKGIVLAIFKILTSKNWQPKKNPMWFIQRVFLYEKNAPKLPNLKEKNSLKLPYLENQF